MKSLSAFGQMSRPGNLRTMKEVEGIPLTLQGFNIGKGQFGEIYYTKAVTPEGEIITVMVGGFLIKDALDEAAAAEAFPLKAVFMQKGKAWIAVEPDEVVGEDENNPSK